MTLYHERKKLLPKTFSCKHRFGTAISCSVQLKPIMTLSERMKFKMRFKNVLNENAFDLRNETLETENRGPYSTQ